MVFNKILNHFNLFFHNSAIDILPWSSKDKNWWFTPIFLGSILLHPDHSMRRISLNITGVSLSFDVGG